VEDIQKRPVKIGKDGAWRLMIGCFGVLFSVVFVFLYGGTRIKRVDQWDVPVLQKEKKNEKEISATYMVVPATTDIVVGMVTSESMVNTMNKRLPASRVYTLTYQDCPMGKKQ
jgi:hypothetical protein